MTPSPQRVAEIHAYLTFLISQLCKRVSMPMLANISAMQLYDDNLGQVLRRLATYIDHGSSLDNNTRKSILFQSIYFVQILGLTPEEYETFWSSLGGQMISRFIRWSCQNKVIADADLHQNIEFIVNTAKPVRAPILDGQLIFSAIPGVISLEINCLAENCE